MTKQEIEKLERICKENGFDIKPYYTETDLFVIEPEKDEWEGVEFIEGSKGNIYKVERSDSDGIFTSCGKFFDWNYIKKTLKPSTEQAYKEQLIAEAKKRFGDIKDGDRFKTCYPVGFEQRHEFVIGDRGYDSEGFVYNIYYDSLMFNGHTIYDGGKWAERVEEEMKFIKHSDTGGPMMVYCLGTFGFTEKELMKIDNYMQKIYDEKN